MTDRSRSAFIFCRFHPLASSGQESAISGGSNVLAIHAVNEPDNPRCVAGSHVLLARQWAGFALSSQATKPDIDLPKIGSWPSARPLKRGLSDQGSLPTGLWRIYDGAGIVLLAYNSGFGREVCECPKQCARLRNTSRERQRRPTRKMVWDASHSDGRSEQGNLPKSKRSDLRPRRPHQSRQGLERCSVSQVTGGSEMKNRTWLEWNIAKKNGCFRLHGVEPADWVKCWAAAEA